MCQGFPNIHVQPIHQDACTHSTSLGSCLGVLELSTPKTWLLIITTTLTPHPTSTKCTTALSSSQLMTIQFSQELKSKTLVGVTIHISSLSIFKPPAPPNSSVFKLYVHNLASYLSFPFFLPLPSLLFFCTLPNTEVSASEEVGQ